MRILVFEDKLGVTSGYLSIWEDLLAKVGLPALHCIRFNAHKSPVIGNLPLLIKKGNRKSPGFNPDPRIQAQVATWFAETVRKVDPIVIVIMDVALLGLLEPNWDAATIDNLRGGLYFYDGKPIYVTVPISAINTKKKLKDIKLLNEGAATEAEFEEQEHDPEDFFIEPYTIPAGKWILRRDLQKIATAYRARLQ